MPGLLETRDSIAPLESWKIGHASWISPGNELEASGSPYGELLSSPPIDLAGGFVYEVKMSMNIVEGGVTFEIRNPSTNRWLQSRHHIKKGQIESRLTVRLTAPRQVRLVLANCQPSRFPSTRISNLSLCLTRHPLTDSLPATHWKQEIRTQWDTDPCGDDRGAGHPRGTLAYFEAVEKDRYQQYAPWMPEAIGFTEYAGKKLLEIGGGLGTDLVQFARAGAHVTDLDMSQTHLNLAKQNFLARDLAGVFIKGDAENLPFPSNTFDVVYCFGVLHHTPGTEQAVRQVYRVLKPGGKIIAMIYAKHSWNYWYTMIYRLWWRQGLHKTMSIADVLSGNTEHSPSGGRPLVKVYSARQCRRLFTAFRQVQVKKYQLTQGELPPWMLKIASANVWSKIMGWNLLVHAVK